MARPVTKPWFELGLLVVFLAVLILVYFYVASSELRDLVRPHHCLLSQSTGLLCPACGGTRAMIHLFNGHLMLALKSNLLAVVTLPLVMYAFFLVLRLAFDSRFTPADIRIAPFWIWSYFIFVLLFWVLRNIPSMVILRPYL